MILVNLTREVGRRPTIVTDYGNGRLEARLTHFDRRDRHTLTIIVRSTRARTWVRAIKRSPHVVLFN